MRAMMPAQMMMPAGQGQQRLYYAMDNMEDNTTNNGDASTISSTMPAQQGW